MDNDALQQQQFCPSCWISRIFMSKKKIRTRLANRIVAAVLAATWLAAGLLVLAFGLFQGRWLMILLGSLGIGYGLLWVRVVWEGRQLTWPDRLLPWRRRR
jgi:hypothetical protein